MMAAWFRQFCEAVGQRPVIACSGALLMGLLWLALLGPVVVPYHPLMGDVAQALQPPSQAHWLGTDQWGRDVLSRVIIALRFDLGVAVAAVVLSLVVGCVMGGVAGLYGGWWDWIVARVVEAITAFPPFILAMGMMVALGSRVVYLICALTIINVSVSVRVSRAVMRRLRGAGFVVPAQFYGDHDTQLLVREWWPRIFPLIMAEGALCLGGTMLHVTGLAFIGLGPAAPSWGAMLAEGATSMATGEWWLALFPGLFLMLMVLGCHGLGDGLRDLMAPRT